MIPVNRMRLLMTISNNTLRRFNHKLKLCTEDKELILKLCLYFISLWILLSLLIVLKIDIQHWPHDFSWDGLVLLWQYNSVTTICIILFVFGLIGFLYFRNLLDDAKRLPVKIIDCESVNFENLSFLATYIIPLVGFKMDTDRDIFVLFSVIIITGCIFAKTNLYYSNPTLLLVGFNVYKVKTNSNDMFKEGIVIIQGKIKKEDMIKYFKFSDNVYFGRKVYHEDK